MVGALVFLSSILQNGDAFGALCDLESFPPRARGVNPERGEKQDPKMHPVILVSSTSHHTFRTTSAKRAAAMVKPGQACIQMSLEREPLCGVRVQG